jgi:hypothetical protein
MLLIRVCSTFKSSRNQSQIKQNKRWRNIFFIKKNKAKRYFFIKKNKAKRHLSKINTLQEKRKLSLRDRILYYSKKRIG